MKETRKWQITVRRADVGQWGKMGYPVKIMFQNGESQQKEARAGVISACFMLLVVDCL